MNKTKFLLITVLTAFIIITHTGCGGEEPISKEGFCLDTVCTITIYDDDSEVNREEVLEAAFELIDEREAILSKTIDGSDVSRINSAKGDVVDVENVTRDVIEMAQLIAEESEGAFDITIGKVSELWDFHAEEPKLPDDEDIKTAVSHVDYGNVQIRGNEVSLADNEAEIDLGGIAKGYIADQVGEYLESEGVRSAIINLGGNVVAIGKKPDDSAFNIGIERPFTDRTELIGSVQVFDATVVTSGIYERNFVIDNKIYHHILDSTTGYPAETDLEAVTIVAAKGNSGFCDAISTACLALGKQKAMDLIKSIQNEYPDKNIEASFIDNDGNIVQTEGMDILPVE